VIAKWGDISMGGAKGWQVAVVTMVGDVNYYKATFNRRTGCRCRSRREIMLTERCPAAIPANNARSKTASSSTQFKYTRIASFPVGCGSGAIVL